MIDKYHFNLFPLQARHSGAILCSYKTEDYFVTGSEDNTIKIHSANCHKKIGEFYCDSPVTSLSVAEEESSLHIFAGTQLGHIYSLSFLC